MDGNINISEYVLGAAIGSSEPFSTSPLPRVKPDGCQRHSEELEAELWLLQLLPKLSTLPRPSPWWGGKC